MKLKRPTSDVSIENMKRDFAFDFENQTKFLACTEVEIGWGSGDVILFIININNIFPARTVLKAVKKHCSHRTPTSVKASDVQHACNFAQGKAWIMEVNLSMMNTEIQVCVKHSTSQ